MDLVKNILIVLEVLLLFNLLIFVHELGHFLAARWRGLKVERFAIWFGKPIWKKRIGDVEYCLGTIPAGGYVSLPQMAPMDLLEGKPEHKDLAPVSPLDKIIVAFAGPLFSFLLAVAFAVVVWIVGKPAEGEKSTVIGWVVPDGPAWKAGLRAGDRVLEVDGQPVSQFAPPAQDSLTWRIIASEGTNIVLKYERNGEQRIAEAVPFKRPTKWFERKALRQILVGPTFPSIVGEVITNSPAALGGLRPGDEIVALNGERIYSPEAVGHAEQSSTNAGAPPLSLTVRRDGKEFEASLRPEDPLKPAEAKPSLGIVWQGTTNTVLVHPTPGDQVRASVSQIVGTLQTLISRKSDVGVQQLGGAVMIIRVYKNLFENENGWRLVLWFSVIMNVNLALLNLLPLPVLDGGHITLSLIEMVRRRPVSGKILSYVQSAFAVALIAFMIFIAFFDTGDWVRSAGARKDREQEIIFAPKPQ